MLRFPFTKIFHFLNTKKGKTRTHRKKSGVLLNTNIPDKRIEHIPRGSIEVPKFEKFVPTLL